MYEAAHSARLDSLQEDVSEIKDTTRKMAEALERLARLEERHASVSASLDRAFTSINKVQDRVTKLETGQPLQNMTSNWVMDWVKFAAGAAVMFVLKRMGAL